VYEQHDSVDSPVEHNIDIPAQVFHCKWLRKRWSRKGILFPQPSPQKSNQTTLHVIPKPRRIKTRLSWMSSSIGQGKHFSKEWILQALFLPYRSNSAYSNSICNCLWLAAP
jgi:hypothetical protein